MSLEREESRTGRTGLTMLLSLRMQQGRSNSRGDDAADGVDRKA